MSFSGVLALFDPVAKIFKAVRNILVTTLSASSTGSWTISGLPTTVSNVYVIPATDLSGLSEKPIVWWSFTSNTGTLTITMAYAKLGSAVTGVSVTTGVKVTGVSVTTGASVDKVSVTTASAIQPAGLSYASVVSSIGNDVGLWTSDSSGNLSHTHAVSTIAVVTGMSSGTLTVVTGVSATTGVKVTGVSVSTGSTVDSVTASTGTFVAQLFYDTARPVTTKPLTVLVIW
ncbi:MAG: hypothetical protein ACP5HP_03735 [Thermogladius sp.]